VRYILKARDIDRLGGREHEQRRACGGVAAAGVMRLLPGVASSTRVLAPTAHTHTHTHTHTYTHTHTTSGRTNGKLEMKASTDTDLLREVNRLAGI
jgi:hypothetical protein